MSELILPLEGAEPDVLASALSHYAAHLARGRALGGVAAEVDASLGPILTRLQARLAVAMYPRVDDLSRWEEPELREVFGA